MIRNGPWRLSKYLNGRKRIIIDADGFDVAEVHYPDREPHARLIAAAPELYAALVALAAISRRYLPDYDENPEIQRADDIIAKVATGL